MIALHRISYGPILLDNLKSEKILEIDTKAFKNNVYLVQNYIGKDTLIMPVLKANAYGTYINKKIELVNGFKLVGVSNSYEGETLRKSGFKNDIFP